MARVLSHLPDRRCLWERYGNQILTCRLQSDHQSLGESVGGYLPIDKAEGPAAQYNYYQQTYQQAQQSLDSSSGLKGIMFWRWAGVDPTAVLSGTDFNEAATIGAQTLKLVHIAQNWRTIIFN